jgi:hypothetical protein
MFVKIGQINPEKNLATHKQRKKYILPSMKLWCEIFVGVEVIRLDHDGLGGRGRRDCHVGPKQLYTRQRLNMEVDLQSLFGLHVT